MRGMWLCSLAVEVLAWAEEGRMGATNQMRRQKGLSARVSEVLSRKRGLTLPMIRRVRQGLGISADLLVGTGKSSGRKG